MYSLAVISGLIDSGQSLTKLSGVDLSINMDPWPSKISKMKIMFPALFELKLRKYVKIELQNLVKSLLLKKKNPDFSYEKNWD